MQIIYIAITSLEKFTNIYLLFEQVINHETNYLENILCSENRINKHKKLALLNTMK